MKGIGRCGVLKPQNPVPQINFIAEDGRLGGGIGRPLVRIGDDARLHAPRGKGLTHRRKVIGLHQRVRVEAEKKTRTARRPQKMQSRVHADFTGHPDASVALGNFPAGRAGIDQSQAERTVRYLLHTDAHLLRVLRNAKRFAFDQPAQALQGLQIIFSVLGRRAGFVVHDADDQCAFERCFVVFRKPSQRLEKRIFFSIGGNHDSLVCLFGRSGGQRPRRTRRIASQVIVKEGSFFHTRRSRTRR